MFEVKHFVTLIISQNLERCKGLKADLISHLVLVVAVGGS